MLFRGRGQGEVRVARGKDQGGCLEGSLLHSFREEMRGFHDLLKQKQILFMLLGWSSILITSLMIRTMYLDMMHRIIWCPAAVSASQIDAVLHHVRFVQMHKMYVPVVNLGVMWLVCPI
jgi:hypothetical protein